MGRVGCLGAGCWCVRVLDGWGVGRVLGWVLVVGKFFVFHVFRLLLCVMWFLLFLIFVFLYFLTFIFYFLYFLFSV